MPLHLPPRVGSSAAIAATTVVAVLLPPPAPVLAAARTATDAANQVSYRLSGRDLTVRLDADTPAALVERLQGRRIRFACGREGALTSVARRWPASAHSVRVRLPRPPGRLVFCGMEPAEATDDLSYAFFD